jgi:hypothetical protein
LKRASGFRESKSPGAVPRFIEVVYAGAQWCFSTAMPGADWTSIPTRAGCSVRIVIRLLNAVVFALVLGTALAVTIAAPASGTPPTRTTEPPFDFASDSLFCGFPLRSETLRNNVKITTFSDGRQLVTGGRTVRLTNLSSGRSLTLRDVGSLKTDPGQTVDTFTGRLVLFLFPGEPFGPGAWLFVGRTVATFAEPGGFTYSKLEHAGKRVDLCAALRR